MARVGLSSNRKFLRLARALGNKALARGVLEVLWEPCFECGDPYVGTATDIEAVCEWQGAPGALTKALLDAGAPKGAGFIEPYEGTVRDRSEPHYQVHDFFHHCPEYARTRKEREQEVTIPKLCEVCGKPYHSRDLRSQYCGPRCKQVAYRERYRRDNTHDVENIEGNTPVVTDRYRPLLSVTDRYPTPTPTPVRTYAVSTPSTDVRSTHGTPLAVRRKTDDDGSSESLTRSEPAAVIDVVIPNDPLVLTFPTIGTDGTEWYLNQSQVDEWRELFPEHDVLGECRKALAWIRADSHRRKTKRGMPKFLAAWLTRSCDQRGGRGPALITGSLKTAGNQAALEAFVNRGGTK